MFRTERNFNAIMCTSLLALYHLIFVSNCIAKGEVEQSFAENSLYEIVISKVKDVTDDLGIGKIITINVTNKRTGEIKQLETIQKMDNVEDCLIADSSKAIITASLTRHSKMAIIIELARGIVQDSVRYYTLSLSNSRKYFVYKSWYPPYGPQDIRKSILFLYDLTRVQMENYALMVESPEVYAESCPGIPIFPEKNASELSADIYLEPKWQYPSPLAWSPDDSKLAFVAYNTEEKTNYLVCIDFSGGFEFPQISKRLVLVEDVKTDNYSLEEVEIIYRNTDSFILASDEIVWLDEERVLIKQDPHRQWLQDTVFSIPKAE